METRFVGLDVHRDTIAIAVADGDGSQPADVCIVPHEEGALMRQLKRLGARAKVKCCYEAGPTGYGLHRALLAAGIDCAVVAPSQVPKQPGNRVKTDRRDARNLARFLRSGDLSSIHVPDPATEAVRDLVRARADAKNIERVARMQLTMFLLRHGRRYDQKRWTLPHMKWIRGQQFEYEAQHRVLVDYVKAVQDASDRVKRLSDDLRDVVSGWAQRPLVDALQALRGVQFLTAVTLVAEIGDFTRFERAPELMSYVGLVPSEHSSGPETRRGAITRAGNVRLRTAIVEAAWAYRFRPAMSYEIKKRSALLSDEVRAIAWKAQLRLCSRYRKLTARGKRTNQAITAVARELTGFVWAIARQHRLQAAIRPSRRSQLEIDR